MSATSLSSTGRSSAPWKPAMTRFMSHPFRGITGCFSPSAAPHWACDGNRPKSSSPSVWPEGYAFDTRFESGWDYRDRTNVLHTPAPNPIFRLPRQSQFLIAFDIFAGLAGFSDPKGMVAKATTRGIRILPMTAEDSVEALCERGQAELMAMDYLAAGRTLARAERIAWADREWDLLSRLYMPLQESAPPAPPAACGEGICVPGSSGRRSRRSHSSAPCA